MFKPPFLRTLIVRAAAVVAIVVLTLVVDRAASSAIATGLGSSGFRFARLYNQTIDADVLAVGDSRAVNAFHAPSLERHVGGRVFNIAYNGMSMRAAQALVEDYLERNHKPRVLLIEVTNLMRHDGLVNDLRMFAGQSTRLRTLHATQDPAGAHVGRWMHLFRYNSEMALRALYYIGRDDQDAVNRYRIDPNFAEHAGAMKNWKESFRPVTDRQFDALRATVQRARANGVEVVLVISPLLPVLARDPAWHAWRDAVLPRLAEFGAVLDYSGAVTDPSAFADPVHLNDIGAAQFAGLLARGLVK